MGRFYRNGTWAAGEATLAAADAQCGRIRPQPFGGVVSCAQKEVLHTTLDTLILMAMTPAVSPSFSKPPGHLDEKRATGGSGASICLEL
jgi:hypothetical protein